MLFMPAEMSSFNWLSLFFMPTLTAVGQLRMSWRGPCPEGWGWRRGRREQARRQDIGVDRRQQQRGTVLKDQRCGVEVFFSWALIKWMKTCLVQISEDWFGLTMVHVTDLG
jgi:hypothetical protein